MKPRKIIPDKSESSPVLRVGYSIEEAAISLGIGRTLVYKLIGEGQLKPVKLGKRTIIPAVELDAFLSRLGGAA